MNYFSHNFIVLSVVHIVFGNSGNVGIVQSMVNCPRSPRSCFTLANCLQNTSACLINNSVVTFTPGDHFTEDSPDFITIKRRQNLTLKVEHSASGQVTALASIYCLNGMGFAFLEMDNFTIMGLRFFNCGAPIPDPVYYEAIHEQTGTYYFFFEGTKTTLFMVNIFNLVIDGLHVNNSDGYGLFIINALGRSSISNSQFSYNNYHALHYHQYNPEYCDARHIPNITSCTGSNFVVLFQDEPSGCPDSIFPKYVLQIANSTFNYGVNLDYFVVEDPPPNYTYNAGGLSIFTGQITYSLQVHVRNIAASNNIGHYGANAVVYIHDIKGVDVVVHIEGSEFINGNADLKFSSNIAFAGGMYIYYGSCVCDLDYAEPCRSAQHKDNRTFALTNSTFINNHGFQGAAIYLESVIDDEDLNGVGEEANFYVTHCRIMNNTGYAGIIKVTETRTSTSSIYRTKFDLSRTVISNNLLMEVVHMNLLKRLPVERSILSTVGIFEQTYACNFTNNTISHNVLVGLHLEGTEIDFHGDSFIVGNNIIGGFGGGIRIYHGGFIRLWHNGTLSIINNSADLGGGIYVDHIFNFHKKGCFFDIGIPVRRLNGPARVKLWNNKAKLAGNSIYGGYIDNCSLTTSHYRNHNVPGIPCTEAFPILFDIPLQNNSLADSEVTSDIRNLCFCKGESPSCDLREKQEVIFPGQEIIIPAVAVG